jgi:hypothetical protein
MLIRIIAAGLLSLALLGPAAATPARLIILRHGEKATSWKLCGIGLDRADALATTYLGRGAVKSLFANGEAPAAILAITPHALELAAPAAQTWPEPITLYAVLPDKDADEDEKVDALNQRTQEAAHDVMTDPAYAGKTVVMVWEHKHIANAKLEAEFAGTAVTLRQLFKLDQLNDVPKTWPGATYDYFWIVDFADQSSATPTHFTMVKQEFGGDFADVPANDWDTPNGMTEDSGCKLKAPKD